MVPCSKTFVLSLATFSLVSLSTPAPLQAQSITPAADGTGTSITLNGQHFEIEGGSLSGDGQSLFHSFGEFGLTQDQIATFLSQPQIVNILGRVVNGNPSLINGTIQIAGGNSNLFLINPAGIVFGAHANLDVPASFTATTATSIGLDGGWFSATGANDYQSLTGSPNRFAFNTTLPGSIINAGDLAVGSGESLSLIGGNVISTGSLSAPSGNVTVMSVPGTSRVQISQQGMVLSLEVDANDLGEAGIAGIALKDLPGLLTGNAADVGIAAIDDSNLTLAQSGTVIPIQDSTTLIAGEIDVSGTIGGEVSVLGDRVALVGATLNASGGAGGGTILVGGDYQGQGPTPTAARTFVNSNSTLNADAVSTGNGGQAIVWADEVTGFYGDASAQGGELGGDGGLIEISGKDSLTFQGTVDTSAPAGADGTLLFDPANINIVAGAGVNDPQLDPNIPTATDPAGEILAAHGGAATFEIGTTSLQMQTGNVVLQATNNITIANGVSLTFDPGIGSITFSADSDSDGSGDFSMDTTQSITANARNLTISGANITTGNIDTSSTGMSAGGSASTISGTVTFTASGAIRTGDINSSAEITPFAAINAEAEGGNVNLTAGTTINTGTINTSANAISGGGGIAEATAGGVSLTAGSNPGSNVTFTSINASASATGGTTNTGDGGQTNVLATGTVQGTGAGTTINTVGTTTTGAVTVRHDGGPNNVPFAIGDASQNGLAGSINGSLTSGSFPVLETGGNAAGTPAGITLISINDRPSADLTGVLPLTGAQQGQSFNLTLAGLLSASDANSDVTSLAIGSILQGTLTRNGIVLQAGDTVSLGDDLVYTPPAGVSGILDAFTIQASDGVALSSNQQIISVNVAAPQAESITNSTPFNSEVVAFLSSVLGNNSLSILQDEDVIPRLAPLPNLNERPDREIALEIFTAERRFTEAFETYLGKKGTSLKDLEEIRKILQEIERATGVKPAVIYAVFFPPTITVTTKVGQAPVQKDAISKQAHLLQESAVEAATQPAAQPKDREDSASEQAQLLKTLPEHEETEQQVEVQEIAQTIESFDLEPKPTDVLELLLVTGDGEPVQRVLPSIERQEMERVVRAFIREVTDPARRESHNYLESSKQIYDWLVAPMEAALQEHEIENIVFIVDEGLRSMPLAALHNGHEFILERYSVGLMPSISLTDTRHQDLAAVKVLAAGAERFPGQDKPALPSVPVEVSAISEQLWPGKSILNQGFTFRGLEKSLDAQPFGIIHLATHADFRQGEMDRSYIQFWDEKLPPGKLRELGLGEEPTVELVTLSACRTAIGDADAELGFAGLAVQTGAKTAIGSLWYVDDVATMGLMTNFYQQLQQSPIKAEALRQAQLAVIRGEVHLEGNELVTSHGRYSVRLEPHEMAPKDLSHPFYWSGFTMIGSPW